MHSPFSKAAAPPPSVLSPDSPVFSISPALIPRALSTIHCLYGRLVVCFCFLICSVLCSCYALVSALFFVLFFIPDPNGPCPSTAWPPSHAGCFCGTWFLPSGSASARDCWSSPPTGRCGKVRPAEVRAPHERGVDAKKKSCCLLVLLLL